MNNTNEEPNKEQARELTEKELESITGGGVNKDLRFDHSGGYGVSIDTVHETFHITLNDRYVMLT